jgi:predicted amidohydrolase YtcJ
VAQALAIREGKIVSVGNTANIRRLAGANTKSIDLKGRTVVPGFIVTHDHPQEQAVPRKAMFDAGVMNNLKNDRPIEYTDLTFFDIFYTALTRKDQNGTAYAPAMALDRQAMLKVATLFGAYATKKEDVLGSLEPGKWADLTVMDKDYLTVPLEEMRKIRILMTMVGGKIQHLAPSLAREIGMPPAGAQVELGEPASQW